MPRTLRHGAIVAVLAFACVTSLAAAAPPEAAAAAPKKARIVRGKAIAPKGAPLAVRRFIAAGNRIRKKPYRYGGGHRSYRIARGYDCSGAVSFALHGARLLRGSPRTSGGFRRWGRRGRGRWITVYAHGGHVYAVVAGLRFDTSMHDRGAHPGRGPRWSKRMRSPRRFAVRHPRGL